MLNEINEIIRKNLPFEVGENLQKVLKEGEKARLDLIEAEKLIKSHRERLEDYKNQENKIKSILDREELLRVNEFALQKKEWELKVKEAELKGLEKAFEMNHMTVQAVFANNRYKYSESGNTPLSGPHGITSGFKSVSSELQG